MGKFRKLYEIAIGDGIASIDQFYVPERPPRRWLELAHAPHYVEAYLSGAIDARMMRRIGLPWSEALVNRTCLALAGTIRAAELALAHGLACNLAGGTHHAYYDFGSGYCIFNDLAVTARLMVERGVARRVLIVDLDVHQGDGTAAICQGDERIFTFSMHCGVNFPFEKQTSDLDVTLPVGLDDKAYLATLAHYLPDLLSEVKPALVLYDAGVDPHMEDELGKLALSDEGLYQRDHLVLTSCGQQGIPIAGVIGGGYQRDIERLARRHSILLRAASDVYPSL
jgi:acetoin utilization deacetylase AcuC-like enzyme